MTIEYLLFKEKLVSGKQKQEKKWLEVSCDVEVRPSRLFISSECQLASVKLSYLGPQAAVQKTTTPQNKNQQKANPKAGTARRISVSQFELGVSQDSVLKMSLMQKWFFDLCYKNCQSKWLACDLFAVWIII